MIRGEPTTAGWVRRLPCVVAVVIVAACTMPAATGAAGFERLDPAPLQTFKPFDLGVADANDDGSLDLFTINHKFPSRMLAGDGNGGLYEATAPLGLSPTPAFPGFEDLHRAPVTSAPGAYLYATDRGTPRDPFHIDATGVTAAGRLTFGARDLRVLEKVNATTSTTVLPNGTTAFDFEVQPGGSIDLTVNHIDLPIQVRMDSPSSPGLIKVGPDAVPARGPDFVLSLRDRHGYGFADFNSDGASDLFIAAGGLGGEISDPYFVGRQRDELLLGGPGGFRPAIDGSGLVKGACRGRSVVVADFDGDGPLDLLESCEEAPPRVFAGDGAGHFSELPAPPVAGDTYRAVQLTGGLRPEVVVAAGRSIEVWSLAGAAWTREQRIRGRNGTAPVRSLATGDWDRDGDLDLFAASPGGNTLLSNAGGRLRGRAPRTAGLPNGGSAGAAFVDYDNDGDLDLHLLPQGLHRSDGERFHSAKRLRYGRLPTGKVAYGTVSWPDLDEDGRRDPVTMRSRGEFAPEALIDLRRSRVSAGHWLQLELVGPPGNRQAIGARVRVASEAGSSWGWVGESESSGHSYGHYRLYFGLGDKRRVHRIVVTWPDGSKRKLGARRGDRLLRVRYGGRTRG